MKWISVKEKLPPHDGSAFLGFDPDKEEGEKIYVLIYIPEKKYSKALYGRFWIQEEYYQEASGEGYFTWKITHWMPLPSPPKKE